MTINELAKEMIGVDFEKVYLDETQMSAIINICRCIIAAKDDPDTEGVYWEDLAILLQGYQENPNEKFTSTLGELQEQRDAEFRQKWQDIYDRDEQDLH